MQIYHPYILINVYIIYNRLKSRFPIGLTSKSVHVKYSSRVFPQPDDLPSVNHNMVIG